MVSLPRGLADILDGTLVVSSEMTPSGLRRDGDRAFGDAAELARALRDWLSEVAGARRADEAATR